MFTEDYLMRIISQAVAALMSAIGLKKAGKYSEALQALDQAYEQLSGLPAAVFKQLDDTNLLAALTVQGQLDIGRLAVLADIFREEADVLDSRHLPGPHHPTGTALRRIPRRPGGASSQQSRVARRPGFVRAHRREPRILNR